MCRVCEEPTSVENEDHLLQCKSLLPDQQKNDVKFMVVVGPSTKQKMAVQLLRKCLWKRDLVINYKQNPSLMALLHRRSSFVSQMYLLYHMYI